MIAVDENTIREDIRQWSGLVLAGAWVALVRLPPNRGGIDYKESHAREAEEVRR